MTDEPYEALVASIAMIDAAMTAIVAAGLDDCNDWASQLIQIRNSMNDTRVLMLGGGTGRPFHVAELIAKLPQETRHD